MLGIAVCDDNERDSANLHLALTNQLSSLGQAAEIALYPCGEALLAAIEEDGRSFDLIFLDIYMAGLTGMEAAHRLRKLGRKTPLIFLTSSPDFAVEGYEVAAAGYLLKPLVEEKLAPLLSRLLTPVTPPRLALKHGGGYRYYDYDEICYVESRSHALHLHLSHGVTVQTAGRLDMLEGRLHDKRFLRCHQSYLVNMDYVYKVGDDFLLRNGAVVPIRVRSRKAMTDAYYSFFVSRTTGKEASHV